MGLSIAIQMDKVESLQIAGDTTFALGLEAQKRGHNLWYYTPDLLSLNEEIISARGQELAFYDEVGAYFKTGAAEIKPLREFDVILMRQDPPFDMAYITATYLLEMLSPKNSAGSAALSASTGIWTSFMISPSSNVTLPWIAMKSDPSAAAGSIDGSVVS